MTIPNGQQNGNGNGKSTAIVAGPQARLNTIKSLLDKSKGSIAAVLPKHLTPERLIKIATSAASRSPELLDCSPESLLLAVVQAGTLGLEPSTPLHHCALVAVNNNKTGKKEAQLWLEYRGLCQLAYQSGEVLDIYAHTVHENDVFEFEYGTDKSITHRFDVREPRGEAIAYYGVVVFKSGGKPHFEVLTKGEVDRIRERSPGKNSPAWVNDYDRMGEKSAIKRALRTAPMSQDKSERLGRALDHEARMDRGEVSFGDVVDVIGEVVDPETGEVTNEQPKSKADAMKDRLVEKAAS